MIVSAQEFAATLYDYLVVGGGTAGLVLANRLSEDPDTVVGVVEAGEWHQDDPNINIPGYYGRALSNPDLNWGFSSVPQKALNDRVCPQARGKGLGGSSTINFMLCGRGSANEYDSWSSELSFPGWDWNSLLPYFLKAERLTAPPEKIKNDERVKPLVGTKSSHKPGEDSEWKIHGQNGPLTQSYPLWTGDELSPKFLETCEELNLEINTDAANGKNTGASITISTLDPVTGNRVSSSSAYYAPIHSNRYNLHVCLGAQVQRITFTDDVDKESEGKKVTASGVEFVSGDKIYYAKSKKELILCAGAFQSPQLLELSGIGAKKYTEELGIKQRVNLPGVGENLEDHAIITNAFEIDPSFVTSGVINSEEGLKKHMDLFNQHQDGLLTVTPGAAICTLPLKSELTKQQDVERILASVNLVKTRMQKEGPLAAKHHETFEKWVKDPNQAMFEYIFTPGAPSGEPGHAYISINVVLLHALSRGSTHIISSSPSSAPNIDPRYCSEESDLLLLVEGAKNCRRLAQTGTLGKVLRKDIPLPEVKWETYVKENVRTCWHPSSTCVAGGREDGAVVDSQLRVFGTTNIRVVDASILPTLPSHHPQMTIYAVAEKAADTIKKGF